MKKKDTGPLSIFGIRIKTLFVLLIFIALLLIVINRSEMDSLLQTTGIKNNPAPVATESNNPSDRENHLVVDEEMLSKAMKEVQVKKLTELESQDSTMPTDRFFYVVELHSGGDLEGTDLTIEADHVVLVSEGGTQTRLKRTAVKDIHRFKLPPTKEK